MHLKNTFVTSVVLGSCLLVGCAAETQEDDSDTEISSALKERADSNRVGSGQSNPAFADDFFTGISSCRLFQLEGVTDRGEGCLVNVRFGRTAFSGGEGGGTCVPDTSPGGTLTILGSRRRVVASSAFGPGTFSYSARSRVLSLDGGLGCNVRGFYTYPADGNVKPF